MIAGGNEHNNSYTITIITIFFLLSIRVGELVGKKRQKILDEIFIIERKKKKSSYFPLIFHVVGISV